MNKLFLFVCTMLVCNTVFSQSKSLALVIGNGNYEHKKLSSTESNVMEVTRQLSALGYKVKSYLDLSQNEMKSSIDNFGSELSAFDVGLVYYTGLTIQAEGINYLIPVDAQPESANDVEYTCVQLGRVLGKMEDAGTKTNILILDASDDNKFETKWNEDLVMGRGVAFTDAPLGSLIMYSTLPGSLTNIKKKGLSLYTATLMNNINEPNMAIEDICKITRTEVKEESNGTQIPWESSSLEGNYYFSKDEHFSEMTISASDQELIAEGNSREISNFFFDERDGQKYEYVKIGDQVWMSQNLNYSVEDHSFCYDNLEVNCDEFGRLYDAVGKEVACPKGWHLPTDEEWKILELKLGMSRTEADQMAYNRGSTVGGFLKKPDPDLWNEPNNGATDDYGFSVLPGGFRDESGAYNYLSDWGSYWSSSPNTKFCAWGRGFGKEDQGIARHSYLNPWSVSIRCVKDENEIAHNE